MKKFFAILLTLCMIATMSVTAFAAEITNESVEQNGKTDITYNASENGGVNSATWIVTVPATLTAGAAGEVKAEGSWAPSDILSVTADENVNMYLNGDENADYATVPVTYNAIALAGSYAGAVSVTEAVTVDADNAMSAIKFGEWEGTLTFYINLAADPNYVSGNIGGTTPPAITFPEDVVADETWYDADATVLEIADAADFLAFVENAYTWGVSDKANVPNFAGKTITLNADVDLAGYNWTAISSYDSGWNGNGGFQGTFDGNGHTIYNMSIDNATNATGKGYTLGLFGDVGNGAVFKNLTLDGATTYAGNSNAGALVGNILSGATVTFENVTVKNSLIKQGRYAGGIVGKIGDNANVTFTNCKVADSAVLTIHNDTQGPLYGAKYDTSVVTITNCTITNVVEHYYKDAEGNQDWDTYQNITLAEALVKYADEPASNDN